MIKISNVNKTYRSKKGNVEALRNVSIDIDKGEIFGVVGLSGAGKSTLIRTLNRLEDIDSGEIVISGENICNFTPKELRKFRKNTGMIFQNFNLLNSKSVRDNIAFSLEISKIPKKEIDDRVDELIKLVELDGKKNMYPSQLSGGQKQRVAIARALANNPDVLLCDEATSALDPKTTKSILELIKGLRDKLNLTIVLITHQMEVIRDVCDRVAIMEDGQVIELGPVAKVFSNPQTETAKDFISHIRLNDEDEIIPLLDSKGKIVHLGFEGDKAKEPVVSRMIRETGVDVNILSGNINRLITTNVGNLVVEILGSEHEIELALNYLKNNEVLVEEI
jgi:D-methionine transport system ATP-binding protein